MGRSETWAVNFQVPIRESASAEEAFLGSVGELLWQAKKVSAVRMIKHILCMVPGLKVVTRILASEVCICKYIKYLECSPL